MIKAIYHDGQICPLDPVPADWVKSADTRLLDHEPALIGVQLHRPDRWRATRSLEW
jgi:hypothetical protein